MTNQTQNYVLWFQDIDQTMENEFSTLDQAREWAVKEGAKKLSSIVLTRESDYRRWWNFFYKKNTGKSKFKGWE